MTFPKPLFFVPALLLVLAGCGSSTSSPTASAPTVAVTSAAPATSAPDADATSPADDDATATDADASTDPDATDPDATDSDADKDADKDADGDADPADATKACDDDATKSDAAAKLPAGFPAVDGFVGIGEKTAGSTTQIKGAVKGGPDDLPTVRDAGLAKLKAAGYTLGDHDQEAGAEADGDFTGTHSGNINVRNLCKGYLVVTYTLNG